jgi:hypothetical protein
MHDPPHSRSSSPGPTSKQLRAFGLAVLLLGVLALLWARRDPSAEVVRSADGGGARGATTQVAAANESQQWGLPIPRGDSRVPGVAARRLTFVDPAGRPLPAVVLRDLDSAVSIGESDSEGRYDLRALDASRAIRASKPGFLASDLQVPGGELDLRVVLEPAPSLRGQLVDPAGHPIRDARVLVYEAGRRPSPAHLSAADDAALLGERGWATAACEQDGTFEVRGLTRGRRYRLCAGAPGFVLPQPVGFEAGDEALDSGMLVFMPYTVAAVVRLVDFDGGPPITSPLLFGSGPSFRVPGSDRESFHDERSLVLSGIPASRCAYKGRDERLIVWSSTSDPDSVLSRCRVEVPGYDPVDVTLDVPRLAVPVARRDVRLSPPRTDCLGALRVRIGALLRPSDSRAVPPSTRLLVQLRAASGQSMAFTLDLDADASMLLDALPCGDYRAWVESEHRRFKSESVPLSIRREGAADVCFDASGCGAAELHVRTGEGIPYGGQLLVMLSVGGRRSHTSAMLSGPPYRVDFLSPGEYSLRLRLEGEQDPREEVFDLRVGPGEVVFLDCALREE